MRAKDFLAVTAIALWASPAAAVNSCPLRDATPESLHGPLKGHNVRTAPSVVTWESKLERDDDGAPAAYHSGLAGGGSDPGLDHICNGAIVLEVKEGRLVNVYHKDGSVGRLDEAGQEAKRTAMCKSDYIALRDAGFPPCKAGGYCMLWVGILSEPRECGFGKSDDDGMPDTRCGVPVRQRDGAGNEGYFYVSPTWLRRKGSPDDSRDQSDYVDASTVPYIVTPGGLTLPNGKQAERGDLAAVVRGNRTVWAVVGDSGPSDKIGEASRALLKRLGGSTDDPATTILFTGTSANILTHWPLDPARIAIAGRAALEGAGGLAAFRACHGLARLDESSANGD
jgi:hypothetical protein